MTPDVGNPRESDKSGRRLSPEQAAAAAMINTAQAELEAATAEQARTPDVKTISRAEVYALIDYHGDVGAALRREDPAELQRLYEGLDLELIYQQEAKVIEGSIRPGRDSVCVRGRRAR